MNRSQADAAHGRAARPGEASKGPHAEPRSGRHGCHPAQPSARSAAGRARARPDLLSEGHPPGRALGDARPGTFSVPFSGPRRTPVHSRFIPAPRRRRMEGKARTAQGRAAQPMEARNFLPRAEPRRVARDCQRSAASSAGRQRCAHLRARGYPTGPVARWGTRPARLHFEAGASGLRVNVAALLRPGPERPPTLPATAGCPGRVAGAGGPTIPRLQTASGLRPVARERLAGGRSARRPCRPRRRAGPPALC